MRSVFVFENQKNFISIYLICQNIDKFILQHLKGVKQRKIEKRTKLSFLILIQK